jgi:O-antigen/teichoic acid export membrane protein
VAPVSADALLPDAGTDRLHHSTFALLISNGTGVVLGITFWAVAARIYTAHDVGVGAAEINAMTLLSAIALLNLGTLFPRFLYASGSKAGIVLRNGYAASTSLAFVVAVLFLLITVNHHQYIRPGFFSSATFVAAVVLWVIFTIEDAALVGFRAAFWVPVENTSFSIVKIALLPVFFVVAHEVGVFTSWFLPVIACVVVVNLYLWRRVLPAHVAHSAGAGVLPQRKVIRSVLLGEYFGGLAFVSMATLPGLMVIVRLGAQSAAYFQTPWLAGISFDGLLLSFASSLMVEAAARPSIAPATVRRSVRLALLILGPSIVAVLVAAPYLLRILGPQYAAHGTRLLQLLALAMPFMAVNVLYVTFARLARRVRRVFVIQVSIAIIVLTLSYTLLTPLGLNGPGVAYLSGQGLVALIVLPSVIRQYRRPGMSPGFSPGAPLVTGSSGAYAPTSPATPSSESIDHSNDPSPPGPSATLLAEQPDPNTSDGDDEPIARERDEQQATEQIPSTRDADG